MEQLESTQPNRALYLAWRQGEHCPELDGVRGLAILMVSVYRFSREWNPEWHPVLASAKQCLAFGERGVELFFVLSGFLITGILLRTRERPKFFLNFIGRRALRIFPLYYLALFLLLVLVPALG
ncbi:MAG: acyltransferase family protein [Pirellulales bacterium]